MSGFRFLVRTTGKGTSPAPVTTPAYDPKRTFIIPRSRKAWSARRSAASKTPSSPCDLVNPYAALSQFAALLMPEQEEQNNDRDWNAE